MTRALILSASVMLGAILGALQLEYASSVWSLYLSL